MTEKKPTRAELMKYVCEHQEDLWSDLSYALGHAIDRKWSIGCDHALRNLLDNMAVSGGYVVPREDLDWQLSRSPLYDAIALRAGITVEPLADEKRAELDEFMSSYAPQGGWRDYTEFVSMIATRNFSLGVDES